MGDAVGGKGQTGRRPLRGERAKPLGRRTPEVPGLLDREVEEGKEREGKAKKKTVFAWPERRESLKGPKAQGSKRPAPT